MEKCKYCSIKPYFCRQDYIFYDSAIELASGNYTSLKIAADENGRICMRACGDDYTENYYPKFCPECGRKLERGD